MAETVKVQRVDELARMVEHDPALKERIVADPAGAIASLAATPLQSDVWIYRMVVAALSLVALVAIVGTIVLANTTTGVPDALISLGSASVGALAGLVAPQGRSS